MTDQRARAKALLDALPVMFTCSQYGSIQLCKEAEAECLDTILTALADERRRVWEEGNMSAWTSKKPTSPGWYWVRWPNDPALGPEIFEVTQPNGPDTDYLEVNDWPMDEYLKEYQAVEWQPVPPPKE